MVNYEKHEKMVNRQTWVTHNQFPDIPFNELQAQANLIYFEAEASYNEEKGAFTTWLMPLLRTRLLQFGKEWTKVSYMETLPETGAYMSVEDQIIFRDSIMSLSSEAREVVSILFNSPQEIFTLSGGKYSNRKLRGALRDHLRELGWPWKIIRSSFSELEGVFA